MNITGTIVNYYFHCKRQCWLFAHRINLEDNSELVKIGKVMHEEKAAEAKTAEIKIDNIRVDKLTKDYLIEIKKSDADIEAVKWQTLFYLKVLKEKGIFKKGKIEFVEKNKQHKKIVYVELTEHIEQQLIQLEQDIQSLIENPHVPPTINEKKCKKCAYYEYCYIGG